MTASSKPVRIAVDIGGTFTDLQVFDSRAGAVWAYKTPTTPADPSIGLLEGLVAAAGRFGFDLDEVAFLLHGTTIATNAVLEDKLPPGALVTTAGFEDVLEIGRHMRRDVYGVKAEQRRMLIPRERRFGVVERIAKDGRETEPLGRESAEAIIRRLAMGEVEAVAVCLLHAYANPDHERALRNLLREACPRLPVSLSSEVSPEIREFERTSTTVLNALLMPVVDRYLTRLDERLTAAAFSAHLYLVQSNGGVTTPVQAAAQPVRLLLSGPSGGAMAAAQLAQALDQPNLVAIDMGGTSFDVSVVRNGCSAIVTEGNIDGLPVRLPMAEVRTIGAGGGSIAWIDPGGRLRVGPRSAGAEPGPVSYGRGGDAPTVTDANVVLGYIDPDYFLGGALRLDGAAAARALDLRIAEPLGLDLEAAAEGIVSVANASMASAIKLSLFEKGADPHDFALVSFGGAGGLHAAALATELDMQKVIYPRDSATLSARGILFTDIVHDVSRSRLLHLTPDSLGELAGLVGELRAAGDALLTRDDIPAGAREFRLSADLRYPGQAFELLVPWGDVAPDESALADLLDQFHTLHQERFAHNDRESAVELVTLRVTATGRLGKPAVARYAGGGAAEPKSRRRIFLKGRWRDVPVYERETLGPDAPVAGPTIVEEEYTTLLIPPGWILTVANTGDLLATRDGETDA